MFSKQELSYIEDLLKTANDYPDNDLAQEDARALTKALQGIIVDHFKAILEENINQIESNPIWSITSSDHTNIMRQILKKCG